MNGDVLTDLNFSKFYQNHVDNKNIFTISSYTREVKSEFGVLESNKKDVLIGFKEKPVSKYEVSMGIYMVSKRAVECIPKEVVYGFDHLMIDLIQNNEYPSVKKFSGYWLDIGNHDDYKKAQLDVHRIKF